MSFRLLALRNFIKPSNTSLFYVQSRGILDISGRGKDSSQSPEQQTGGTGGVAGKAEQNKIEKQDKEDHPDSIVGKGSAKRPSKDKKMPQFGQGQS